MAGGTDLLRFVTCGSVDDGKSTLIGRLLADSKTVFEDQLQALRRDSAGRDVPDGEVDYSLLVDGLQAEREQGITIDVAYRYFATPRRRFIVADTPGHEQYTRNMATGASTADVAVLLVDARKGLLTQTRRHSFIVSLLGIRSVVLAVNKMDLVDFSEARFREIVNAYRPIAAHLGLPGVTAIPLSARDGDNVIAASTAMPWYDGPSLLQHLETVVPPDRAAAAARLPVQGIVRPHADFRGYAGTLAGGRLQVGDAVVVQPSGATSRIARLLVAGRDADVAVDGDAVTAVLASEIDVGRGDLLAPADRPAMVTDEIVANIVWMSAAPMLPERQYVLKLASRSVHAGIVDLRHRVDVNSFVQLPAKTLALNEIGSCRLMLDRRIACDAYAQNRTTGAFILIDRLSNETVGAGMITEAVEPASNIVWQKLDIDKAARAGQKRQRPAMLWFTGLSGAGKSTVANLVEKQLFAMGYHTYILDGDNIRHGLSRDLGFDDTDRVENIRRIAEVAKLFVDAGLIVLTAFISPFRSERLMARQLVGTDEFVEIFIDTPLEECERRDVKGLYRKAREGTLRNFTGIDSPYEAPEHPEIRIDNQATAAEAAAAQIIAYLREHGYIR